jgi:hypothetical protein
MTTSPVAPLSHVFSGFLEMPYYKNAALASGALHTNANHEDALKVVLISYGYVMWKPEKAFKKKNVDHPIFAEDMPVGSFVEQPFGSQSSPDFFIKTTNNKLVALEAKSSAGVTPLYNSGGVKSNYFYVFSSQKTNQTTIFKGCDIIADAQHQLITEYIADEKKRVDILNNMLKKLDVTERGISYYARPMIGQSGGAKLTNYFTHKNKKNAEQRAIGHIEQIEKEVDEVVKKEVDEVVKKEVVKKEVVKKEVVKKEVDEVVEKMNLINLN